MIEIVTKHIGLLGERGGGGGGGGGREAILR